MSNDHTYRVVITDEQEIYVLAADEDDAVEQSRKFLARMRNDGLRTASGVVGFGIKTSSATVDREKL